MNNAELYDKNNKLQRRDSKLIINDFFHKIRWCKDGRDRLLDIGCGTGSFLMECICSILPAKFEVVLGIDISEEMIKYARQHYEHHEKCTFSILDIGTKELPEELCGQFDHVTSFYCLQWIHDQKTVLANIYKLLSSDGGNCLFGILISHPVYEIYKKMHKSKKWAQHMQDIEKFISPLYYSKDPVEAYLSTLTEAGFTNCELTVYNNAFTYDSTQHLKDFVKSVCPFMERLSMPKQEEFLNDFAVIAENANILNLTIEDVNGKITLRYKLLGVYARKPAKIRKGIF